MTQFVIRDGKILTNCIQFIQGLPSHKEWSVIIKPYKKDLTGQQRRFFHQCVDVIAGFNGDSPEDIKMRIKYACLPLRKIHVNGKTYMVPVSTESLTRSEYSTLIDAALILGSSLGLVMPNPSMQGLEI